MPNHQDIYSTFYGKPKKRYSPNGNNEKAIGTLLRKRCRCREMQNIDGQWAFTDSSKKRAIWCWRWQNCQDCCLSRFGENWVGEDYIQQMTQRR